MTTLFEEVRFRIANAFFPQRLPAEMISRRRMYELFETYYGNNGLYGPAARQRFEVDTWRPDMAALRTPVHRVVEFYASHIWPGALPAALPIVTANERIIPAIQQVWTWSHWGAQKTLAARWAAMHGDLFIKVASHPDTGRPYFQLIEPQLVTDFHEDERGFLTFIRIDTPRKFPDGGAYTVTEVWGKDANNPDEAGLMQIWQHSQDFTAKLDTLGSPLQTVPISDFGIGFIPIVHAKFRDIGRARGVNCFQHALDKIDNANLAATRLDQQVFRHNGVTWALEANSVDADGKPMPPPRIGNIGAGESSDEVTVGEERMVRIPGQATLRPLVPNINYDAPLKILDAHMAEIEKDLPELAYYQLRGLGASLSGRAVRLLLSDVADRVLDVRGLLETGLARADAMALTMGAAAGLEGFTGLGTYEAGDFEHSFAPRDVIPMSDIDKAELVQAWVNTGMPLATAMRRAGFSQDEIDVMEQDKQTAAQSDQAALGSSLTAALKQFDAGAGHQMPMTKPVDSGTM